MAAGVAAVLVGIGFVAAEAIVLGARIRDYDEGVYWQSFRALSRGETLFRSIFTPTPPAFYYTLLPFYRVAPSLTSLRLGDTLLLYTDGLIERRDEPIDDAISGLRRVASRPVGDIGGYADHLLERATSNTNDDACLVAVRVR